MKLSPAPYVQEHVFLVGCPRSGTTLLQRMMHAHPDVAIAPETHFIRRFWKRRAFYGSLHQDENFSRLLNDIVHIPAFEEMHLNPEQFQHDAWTGLRTYAALFGLLLNHFARLQGVRIVGEKTPDHLMHMPTLRAFFPAARFVHIVRDPRAVVNSFRNVPWSKGTLARDAEVWRRHVAYARRTTSQIKAAVHTIHYEQLIVEPEASLQSICHFLGLPYTPCMLDYYQEPVRTVNLEREPWKHNVARPIDTSALDRWRKDLSPAKIATIEAVVLFEMKRWNYQAETHFLLPRSVLHAVWRAVKRLRNWIRAPLRRLLPGSQQSLGLEPSRSFARDVPVQNM